VSERRIFRGIPAIGRSPSIVAFVLCVAAISVAAGADDGYVDEIRKYRESRLERLQAPEGWLSLIGLFWLEQGENGFGSATDQAIVLPSDAAPPIAGSLRLSGTEIRLIVAEDVEITLDGQPVRDRVLADDHDGKPDVLHLGRLSLYVIRRADRFALRVKDPEAESRKRFEGLEYYPVDPAYRVEARFEPLEKPKKLKIPTMVGTIEEMLVPGKLVFSLEGESFSLEPLVSEPGETKLFIIFKDETSGTETYGAGRYLYATLEDGRAVVDFNKAYNPPCAFTAFATCPLAPRGNKLAIAVRAGEKRYGDH
jgi:hypothetical protein